MQKNKRLFNILKLVVTAILFSAALYFENAQQYRLYVLIATFVIYLFLGFGKYFIKFDNNLYFISFIIEISLVYFLEHNSRLLVNYFFHCFYIIILLEAALSLDMKKGIIIGLISVIVSMIKYVYLIYYKFNFSNISQTAFFLMANLLILVIASFAQHNKEEREKKDILYKELLDAHRKLKEYNCEMNRLQVLEERNRIAREIHDSLGHNMTTLIMQLQMSYHFLEDDKIKSKSLILDSVKTARDSLSGIREVVETLRGVDNTIVVGETIRNLINDFSQKTGVDIKFEITGDVAKPDIRANANLYRIIQESMTNAIRHGNATAIRVAINYSKNSISFSIKDNGVGAKIVDEGYGIKGIRERVEDFNGNLKYESIDGFCIKGILYLEEKNDKSTVS